MLVHILHQVLSGSRLFSSGAKERETQVGQVSTKENSIRNQTTLGPGGNMTPGTEHGGLLVCRKCAELTERRAI